MTPELIAIIGTGIALAVVIVPGQRAMRRDLANLEKGMLERMSNLEVRMLERIAHLEGVVEGLVRQRQQEGAPKV